MILKWRNLATRNVKNIALHLFFTIKVAWNYSNVASTTAINNAAASQLVTINQLCTKQKNH